MPLILFLPQPYSNYGVIILSGLAARVGITYPVYFKIESFDHLSPEPNVNPNEKYEPKLYPNSNRNT